MTRIRRATIAVLIGAVGLVSSGAETAPQDAVKLSPQYYTVKAENDRVRVLEYRLKPGEKEVMHSHPPLRCVFPERRHSTSHLPGRQAFRHVRDAGPGALARGSIARD
jgi:hypothetical protein